MNSKEKQRWSLEQIIENRHGYLDFESEDGKELKALTQRMLDKLNQPEGQQSK